ncbi:translation initiation factor eIF2B subunit delta [Parasteatoda tepidariorum]|uniref:translation initiation factor eIF2B subunit delta n=1 Tax=Parasteatoda tepidariorum TaxID=114398 RepID=UPI001C71F187|nr:translation initiation factor eIF-2B subunit delta [Parasteatoda tepidariorum]
MSEPQQSQKKNKKKKKANKLNGNQHELKSPEENLKENDAQKSNIALAAALPQKVGVTTTFNDVEVTMMKNETEVTNGTTKKKKKKKKKQQQSAENAGESLPNEEDNQSLLNFKENHIELVNHPEISVTISNSPVVPLKETTSEDKTNSVSDKKEASEAPSSNSMKKKKKKKKKKNSESESAPAPSAPVPANDDSTPTYVKLPADGGNCVLLVSHDSFSSASRQVPDNNASGNSKNNVPMVVLKNPELNKTESNVPFAHAAAQNENSSSVSIFPVYSDSNNEEKKKTDFNVDSSLNKISNMIKNKEENSVSKNGDNAEVNSTVTEDGEENKPTKAQLKAERRAKQEAQRAAKLAKGTEKDIKAQNSEQTKVTTKSNEQPVSKQVVVIKDVSPNKSISKPPVEQEIHRKVQIFSHLPQRKDLLSKKITFNNSKIPPPILELGSHYAKGILFGSNARCVGFLGAVRQVIVDYQTPQTKTLSKDLESKLQNYFDYLNSCRPLSVNIGNAMKFLKHQINHIPEGMDDARAKESLCQSINDYVREEILLAKEAITISASAKIVNNDTILVFAYSSLVKDVLCKAHDQNKKFHVIVVDSRAKLEGLEMLRRLVKHGLQCSYISINAVSYVIKKVNKVIIGAHALLANGFVMSRLGCKILSLVGSTNSVPVLVCCETYKFWERTLTDSIVHNELGNPDDLVTMSLDKKDSLLKWRDLSSLQIYNLLYDVTPSDFISVVITEKGLIPCTSVPVLLRVKHAGLQE